MKTEKIISDKDLIKAFGDAKFGTEKLEEKKNILLGALRNRVIGYHTGSTITHIMLSLGLLKCSTYNDEHHETFKVYHATEKGLDYLLSSKEPVTSKSLQESIENPQVGNIDFSEEMKTTERILGKSHLPKK